jgi:hypothetical protein
MVAMLLRIPAALLLTAAIIIPSSMSAQWGRHFAIAAGPAIGVDDTPPDGGPHIRLSVAADPGPRTLNLLADLYVTRLVPGGETFTSTNGSLEFRNDETQIGIGLSGLITLLKDRTVSPYLLVGGVYRWSDANGRVVLLDAAGQVVTEDSVGLTADQFDTLFGAGTAIRWGSRHFLAEIRAYGGTIIYLPITVGLTF